MALSEDGDTFERPVFNDNELDLALQKLDYPEFEVAAKELVVDKDEQLDQDEHVGPEPPHLCPIDIAMGATAIIAVATIGTVPFWWPRVAEILSGLWK